MDAGRAAELEALLEGVPLPADKAELLEYAVRRRAAPEAIELLRILPDRTYERIADVGAELLRGRR